MRVEGARGKGKEWVMMDCDFYELMWTVPDSKDKRARVD